MMPIMNSGDNCTYVPCFPGDDIKVGDIVFCQAQPSNLYFCHIVWDKYLYKTNLGTERWCWTIGNNRTGPAARNNGWCLREHIYGKLTAVENRQYDSAPHWVPRE